MEGDELIWKGSGECAREVWRTSCGGHLFVDFTAYSSTPCDLLSINNVHYIIDAITARMLKDAEMGSAVR